MRTRTILLVEDNYSDIELTRRAFQKSRINGKLIVKMNGQDALNYLMQECCRPGKADIPAVVLLDLMLPELDGMEVLKQIRNNEWTKRLPVVILSVSGDIEDINKSYEYGANGYIRKQVDFNQFVETMRNLGHYWLVVNEPPPIN